MMLELKIRGVLKIQEILSLMGTEIVEFQPGIAEIIAFKNFNFTSLIGIKINFYPLVSGFKILYR